MPPSVAVLERAIEPYRAAGFHVVTQSDYAITMRARSPQFSALGFFVLALFCFPLAIIYLVYYYSRKDRIVCIRLTAAGRIEESGYTLDRIGRAQSSVNWMTFVYLLASLFVLLLMVNFILLFLQRH
jgi:hypothetical protein